MPSATFTPGALALTFEAPRFTPARFSPSPLRLLMTMGEASMVIGLSVTDGNRLPRLQRQEAYWDKAGKPTTQMQQHHQSMCERIEQRFTDIEGVLALIQQAQNTASAALQQNNATQQAIDLSASFINPVGVLTASSDGSVAVAAHQRIYAGGATVEVEAGSVSGFVPGDFVTVFYVDAARAGGAVEYQAGTFAVAQSGSTHIVGQVTIPAVGEVPVAGGGPTAPGYNPPPEGNDPREIPYEFAT